MGGDGKPEEGVETGAERANALCVTNLKHRYVLDTDAKHVAVTSYRHNGYDGTWWRGFGSRPGRIKGTRFSPGSVREITEGNNGGK